MKVALIRVLMFVLVPFRGETETKLTVCVPEEGWYVESGKDEIKLKHSYEMEDSGSPHIVVAVFKDLPALNFYVEKFKDFVANLPEKISAS